MDKILVIIPARSGSKGVIKKNIRNVGGKPLIAWTIQQAKAISQINRVIVSTDDPNIASIAHSYLAEVPFLRPKKYALDNSTDYEVFNHAVTWLQDNEGYMPDIVIWLRPTSPMRNTSDIREVINMILQSKTSCIRSITKAQHHPYWMKKKRDNHLIPVCQNKSEKEYPRRQLLPEVFYLNGAVDAFWVSNAMQQQSLFSENIIGYEMPIERSIDIDNELDLIIADLLLSIRK